jgi:hypothetical protein
MSADKGTFGAANMELFDEESEIDVRPPALRSRDEQSRFQHLRRVAEYETRTVA